ncbi:MAG: SelB C-terminal domain-containing protein, partial [Acidobacteriota bacterium]|nr:SelB C-terminal domain-containing protein [Acidobacteriota bacterium]
FAPGDRFVLRRMSPVSTIGGGVVLDPLAPPLARRPAAELALLLERLEHGSLEERLGLWIGEKREAGTSELDLAVRAGVSAAEVRSALGGPLSDGRIHALRRSPDRYLAEPVLGALVEKARSEIAAYVETGNGAVGMPRSTLMSRLLPGAETTWTEAVESALVLRGAFVAAGEEARIPGRNDLPGRERELSERIADVFRQRGLSPPSPAEVAEVVQHRPKVVEGLIGYLVKRGTLVRLPGGWIVARDAVDDVVRRLRASGKGGIEIAEFKEMFNLSRKLAIPLLEHLDGEKVTRRVGDRREILNG